MAPRGGATAPIGGGKGGGVAPRVQVDGREKKGGNAYDTLDVAGRYSRAARRAGDRRARLLPK